MFFGDMFRFRIAFVIALGLTAVAQKNAGAEEPERTFHRPNILWITCEDISPDLGCYGVKHALTPHLDELASQGLRYDNAFALAGVCAVSRSCIITGMYSSSLGSQGMRFHTRLPDHVKCFTEYLRDAGYYCTNNSKTDYNFPVPRNAWDESSGKAHWRGRRPGQPFFAVFNFELTHESQIRCDEAQFHKHMQGIPERLWHKPNSNLVPPFHPDCPESRRDWARYHSLITAMDLRVKRLLDQLEEDGLAGDTIVFFYSDHGAGMPRCKKWSYDAGTRVPLIVRFPEDWPNAPRGEATDRLVSFVDFAPTVLSLCGVQIPEHMQGRAFFGAAEAKPRDYVFTIRDRMAENIDLVRGVRDKRYLYLRNYMPHLGYGRFCTYTQEMPTTQAWMKLAAEGKLRGPPALFFRKTKPLEELFDCQADPHNLENLADDPTHFETLTRLRNAHQEWTLATLDLGYLPECEMLSRIESLANRFAGPSPASPEAFDRLLPFLAMREHADAVGRGLSHENRFRRGMLSDEPAIRYWSVIGAGALASQGKDLSEGVGARLRDDSPAVRMAAAEALIRIHGATQTTAEKVLPVVQQDLLKESEWVRIRAATVLQMLGERAKPALPEIKKALKLKSQFGYDHRLLHVLAGRL